MGFTDEQLAMIKTKPFQYDLPQHQALVKGKLEHFELLLKDMRQQLPHVFIGGVGTVVARLPLLSSLLWGLPVDLMFFGYGLWHVFQSVNLNSLYREAFDDMLKIYDWCIPPSDKGALPATNNLLMQSLIETMGTLVDQSRLERLTPLIEAKAEPEGEGAYQKVSSAVGSSAQQLGNWLTGGHFFQPKPVEPSCMAEAEFKVLVRGYIKNRTTSNYDYYLLGQGSHFVNKIMKVASPDPKKLEMLIKGATTVASVVGAKVVSDADETDKSQDGSHSKPSL